MKVVLNQGTIRLLDSNAVIRMHHRGEQVPRPRVHLKKAIEKRDFMPLIQFAAAQRRCLQCDWPAQCYGGLIRGRIYHYRCRACGHTFTRRRFQLRFLLKLIYYANLWSRRTLTRVHRTLVLFAIRAVNEPMLCKRIVCEARLW